MSSKKLAFVIAFFISFFSFGQDNIIELPYAEKTMYSKINTPKTMMANIVDELGHKYYWATDSLFTVELTDTYHSRNLPKLLLNVVYEMSEALANSISGKKADYKYPIEKIPFSDLRKNTLLNLKETSNSIIESSKSSNSLNINSLLLQAYIAESYCDQIISYRKYIGKSFRLDSTSKEKTIPKSLLFARTLGGDGLTTEQWIELTRYGPQRKFYSENTGRIRKSNTKYLAKLIKQEKAEIEVGNLEPLKRYTNVVENLTYTYFREPPEQLSFLFSYDEEFIKGIVDWITYINSGNPTRLNEIFKMGLGLKISIDKNTQGQLSFDNVNFRDITNKEGNKIRLEYAKEYFDGTNFSDILIHEVHINKNNQIEFMTEIIIEEDRDKDRYSSVVVLKNIDGNLLGQIKLIINQIRDNVVNYNDDNLNLRKY